MYDDMSQDDIEMIRAVCNAVESGSCNWQDDKLGRTPVNISDDVSCILGDGFHFMNRPKVPIHHESKKGYFLR